jgi:hypothetical protein
LRDDILSRRLAEGQHPSKAYLVARFDVNRPTIREAFAEWGRAKVNPGVYKYPQMHQLGDKPERFSEQLCQRGRKKNGKS